MVLPKPAIGKRCGMARTKNQAARREQLVTATIDIIAERGLEAVRLASVAKAAGVSNRLVAYYYADLESLVEEAHQAAANRYYWSRLRALDGSADPAARLHQLIRSGLPRKQDRKLSQVLNELSVSASRSTVHARLVSEMFEHEVSLYLSVLRDGEELGVFELAHDELTIARNLVSLEDAYGFHLLARSSPVTLSAALDLLLTYARAATGAALPGSAEDSVL